jgi:hypothetical protein
MRIFESMISIDQLRELLKDPALTDTQTEKIRDDLYALAALIFERRRKTKIKQPSKT